MFPETIQRQVDFWRPEVWLVVLAFGMVVMLYYAYYGPRPKG